MNPKHTITLDAAWSGEAAAGIRSGSEVITISFEHSPIDEDAAKFFRDCVADYFDGAGVKIRAAEAPKPRFTYTEKPALASPMNALHGLYMVVRSAYGHAKASDLLAFVRDDVKKAGYDPDGNGMTGFPTQAGIIAVTYCLWFYDKRKAGKS